MPLKDQDKAREASRLRMQRHRSKDVTPIVTPDKDVTPLHSKDVTPTMLRPRNVTPLLITKDKAIKLLKVCSWLDNTSTGAFGKRENMLDLVFMGDLTMRDVRERLANAA